MSKAPEQSGLSARRRTFYKFQNLISVFLLILSLFVSSCHEKTNGQNPEKNPRTSLDADSSHKPQVNIKVNKHYDDKGNVVGFDSTYTSFYSNLQGDTANMDSLMSSFHRYFKRDHSSLFDRDFNSLFFNDSTRYPDFFQDDFFLRRYERNDSYFKDMMNRMDSIKNRFYYGHSQKEKQEKRSGDL